MNAPESDRNSFSKLPEEPGGLHVNFVKNCDNLRSKDLSASSIPIKKLSSMGETIGDDSRILASRNIANDDTSLSSDGSFTDTELLEKKRVSVDAVILNVSVWIRSRFDVIRQRGANAGPKSCDATSSKTGSTTQTSTVDCRSKRKVTDRGKTSDGGVDDDEDREGRPRKRVSSKGKGTEPPTFACPFLKYDPEKYSKEGHNLSVCGSHSWPDVHRVKYITSHLSHQNKESPLTEVQRPFVQAPSPAEDCVRAVLGDFR